MRCAWAIVLTACGRIGFDPAPVAQDSEPADALVVTGLLHRWPFDEGAGTTAADVAGNAPAMFQNTATWGAGHCGSALAVDGATGEAVASLDLGGDQVSVTMWAFASGDGTTGYDGLCAAEDPGGNTLYFCLRDHNATPDHVVCSDSTASAPFVETTDPFTIGRWFHLAVTRTATGQFTVYLDGALEVGPGDGGPTFSTGTQFFMGARNGGDPFQGLIDDVRIYDHALSAAEVAALFAEGC